MPRLSRLRGKRRRERAIRADLVGYRASPAGARSAGRDPGARELTARDGIRRRRRATAPTLRTELPIARLVRKLLGPRRMGNRCWPRRRVRGMAIYGTSLGAESGHAPPAAVGGAIEIPSPRSRRRRDNLQAAVFGVRRDGLVSNALSLILGDRGSASALTRIWSTRLRRRGTRRRRVSRHGGGRVTYRCARSAKSWLDIRSPRARRVEAAYRKRKRRNWR